MPKQSTNKRRQESPPAMDTPPADGTNSRREREATEPGPRSASQGNGAKNEIRRMRDHFSPGYHRTAAKRLDTTNSFIPLTYAQVLSSPPRPKSTAARDSRPSDKTPEAEDPFKEALAGSLTQKEYNPSKDTPEPDLSLEYADPESPTPAPRAAKRQEATADDNATAQSQRIPKAPKDRGVRSPEEYDKGDGDESMRSISPDTRREELYHLASPRAPTPAHHEARARRFNTEPPRTEGVEHPFRFAPNPPRGWSTSINGDNMADQTTFTTARAELERERRETRAVEEQERRREILQDQPRVAQLQPPEEGNQGQMDDLGGGRAANNIFHEPIGNSFPEVHGLDEQRCKELIPKEQIDYYDNQALKIATHVLLLLRCHDNPNMCPTARAADVLTIVKKAIPGPSNFIVGSPNYPLKPRSAQHILVPCVGTNFTEEQAKTLLNRRYWGTDKSSIFVLPWKGATSTYLFSITTLNVDPAHPNIEDLPAIWVTDELKKKKALIDFLNKYSDNVPQIPDPPTNYCSDFILNSFSSKLISLARAAQQPDQIVVNIYCWPPTKRADHNNKWLKAVRSLRFFTPYGEAVASTPLSCGWCYALDHPTGLCKYNEYGPSDDTSSSDLTSNNTITSLRRRQYPTYTMREDVLANSRSARGARRGASGRGNGGRGSNGRGRGRGA